MGSSSHSPSSYVGEKHHNINATSLASDEIPLGHRSSMVLATSSGSSHSSFDGVEGTRWLRFRDSFKEMDLNEIGYDTTGLTEMEKSVLATSRHPLARALKSRHLQMIAIGGSIGTGLFVGSGYGLAVGGPGGTLIAYALVGYSMLCVVYALGELSVQFPVSGSFNAFFSRFVDPSWGFSLGIMYACSWLISFPAELVACALTIEYWDKTTNPAVWVAVVYVVIISINLFGIKGFGEVEFYLSIIKVLAVVGFLILGVCIICGVGDQGYIGGRYWHDPGAFNNGFKGLCSVFVSAAFSFGGIELVALAAAETKNPRKSLPRATKQVFWRVTIFYVLTAIIIGCLVPYTNDMLLNGDGIAASPFVIAVQDSGIRVVPHIMNAVVLVAVISVGNSSVYGCSRTLASLAVQRLIPSCFGFVDRSGRPMVSIMFTNAIGLLGFLVLASNQGDVFTWFFSVCSLSSYVVWISVCFTHLRWRKALRDQGRGLDEVAFALPLGIYGSLTGMIILSCIVCFQIYISASPVSSDGPIIKSLAQNCLSLPLLIIIYVVHKTYRRTWDKILIKLTEIDLDSGRRDVDIEVLKQEIADERMAKRNMPLWKRFMVFMF